MKDRKQSRWTESTWARRSPANQRTTANQYRARQGPRRQLPSSPFFLGRRQYNASRSPVRSRSASSTTTATVSSPPQVPPDHLSRIRKQSIFSTPTKFVRKASSQSLALLAGGGGASSSAGGTSGGGGTGSESPRLGPTSDRAGLASTARQPTFSASTTLGDDVSASPPRHPSATAASSSRGNLLAHGSGASLPRSAKLSSPLLGNPIGLGVGVGAEFGSSHSPVAGSTSSSRATTFGNGSGSSPLSARPSWDGWTTPLSSPSAWPDEPLSPRTPVLGGPASSSGPFSRGVGNPNSEIAPWNVSKETLLRGSPDLRRSHSTTMISHNDTASVKGKKRGGFMSKLLRKGSRGDLRDGRLEAGEGHSDTSVYGDYSNGSVLLPHTVPLSSQSTFLLPPKLQARGDTADPLPSSTTLPSRSKRSKRRKPSTPVRSQSTSSPLFGFNPLDTDLGSMEGIVNFNATASPSTTVYDEPRRTLSSRPSEASIAFPQSGSFDSTATSSHHLGRPRQREASAASASSWPSEPISPTRSVALQGESTTSLQLPDDLSRRPGFSPKPLPPPPVPAGLSVLHPPISTGTWTAPDSWAVKSGELGSIENESSEEEIELDPPREEDSDNESALSKDGDDRLLRPGTRGVNGRPGTGGGRPGTSTGRPGTSTGRPGTSGTVRPGTADGNGRVGQQKNFMIRIHRHDATFSTLPAPLTATAAELVATLARKFQVNVATSQRYTLYMREKGLERRMGPHERPILIQKRRFEQAGYTDLDKLEDLGREDNSYLYRLVYRPIQTIRQAAEEDVGDESIEFVDLSGAGIETIPIPLYKVAFQIVSLNLSRNRPFELPTDFVQSCVVLRELVLSHMGLKRIPHAVKECVHLTRLDISNNHIVDLDHVELNLLVELTSLKCHNNRLWSLPEYFARFRTLKYLNLSNNRFETLPYIVCDVASLVELDVSFNTISTIPAEIGQLVELERLLLLANMINSLPPTLRDLRRLRELDCRRNAISDLSSISAINNLEVLRLEYNQASVLDATWEHMRFLNASNNSITRFALAGTSNSLTSLNISNAKLAALAFDMFDHLGSVEHLTFDSNQIRVLPEGVGSLSNLISLSMRNNLLDELPSSIGRLQRLQVLQLSGNNLPAIPSAIWHCSQLMVLNASSNLLSDFPDPPVATATGEPTLEEQLDSRKLSTLSKAGSTASRIATPLALSLQKLYLGDNRLAEDVFVPISLLTELRILNLSFNEIYEIPLTSLTNCQQLEELYLSGNKLTSLTPDDLTRLINLKLLYCNANKLQTLPSELGSLKNLLAFDVGNNVLKYNISNWPYDWNWNWNTELRYLNLSGNKRLEIKSNLNEVAKQPRFGGDPTKNLSNFFSLSRLHVLGLIDVTLRTSLPDENEDRRIRTSLSSINDMAYGIADTLGSRAEVLSLMDIVVPRFRAKDDEAIFGLFDAVSTGQNSGARLVKYLQHGFAAAFTLELSRLKDVEVTPDALRRTFLGMNRDYGNMILSTVEPKRKNSDINISDPRGSLARVGAAGIIVYLRKKCLYVANAGNALAVMAGRNGTARLVAKKHDPFDTTEIARIRMAEGWISNRGAVNDEVDVSRSFGFYNVFPAINAAPNIEEIELTDTDEFIIIANRGLWEHMSFQVAVDVARTERNDPMAAAAKLRDLAISYGSTQNIMVMVVSLGDLFKAKKDYRTHRSPGPDEALDGGFYGQQRSGTLGRRGGRDDVGDRSLQLLNREVEPPVGQIALVFTDIRNSTALWESNPGMQTAIRMHNQLLRRQLRAIGGYEVKTEGDAFMVSFPTLPGALLWCLTVQLELLREDWPQEILDSEEGREITNEKGDLLYRGLSVRMGIHWGAPLCEADPVTRRMDYFGSMVNRSSRIQSVAEGGQIAVSQDVIDILQDVVLEAMPETQSLASGSDTDSDDEEWLDLSEKQDVLALRRLGFGISPLGERRLKGLETPEMLSLIWPSALKDRINAKSKVSTEVHDASTQLLDHNLIRDLGRACQRLESAAGLIAHPERFAEVPPGARNALAKRRTFTNPVALSFAGIRADSTDEELVAALEHFVVRVEHALSSLVLHQLGPFSEVLAALGGALKTDPRYIMNALGRFSTLMAAAS